MTNLKQFMVAKDISNRDMAGLTGVTMRTVINWSAGHKQTPLTVKLLLDCVNEGSISLDWWREQAKRSKGEQ